MKIKIVKDLEEKKKRKKRKKRRKKRKPRAAYWWGYGLHDQDYGDAGDGGGGDGKRDDEIEEAWSEKYKRSIDCDNPKGFSQKAHCAGRKKNEQQELEEKCQKGYKTHPTRKTKEMFGKRYRNCVKAEEGKEPAKGTGKKPKGSSRRLYTDEDPSDTVSVKFATVQDIKDTLSKASFKSKSHKRQSQIINLIHQRARAAYKNAKDPETKARLKKSYEYAEKRKEASKEKTKRLNKQNESKSRKIKIKIRRKQNEST